jgi:hypothetical protein
MDLVAESNRQYYLAWRLMAESASRGTVVTGPDFAITCAGIAIPLFNTAFVFGPVSDVRLREVVEIARNYFQSQGVPGCVVLPDPWHPVRAAEFFASQRMPASLRTTGMYTTDLAAPLHPLGSCDIRELTGDAAAAPMALVNTEAYGMDPRASHVMSLPALWKSPTRAYAIYEGAHAVAVGAAAVLDGVSYIMWMATLTAARRKGYAETIIRRALADTRTARSVLHATGAGFPVYQRLGYRPVVDFPGYVFPEGSTVGP